MTDEKQNTETQPLALSDLAAEVFPYQENASGESGYLGISASEHKTRDRIAKAFQPTERTAHETDSGAQPQWSPEDVQAINQFQAAARQFEADRQRAIAEFGHVDLAALEKSDKARAVQVGADIRERAGSLAQRYQMLEQAGQQIELAGAVKQLVAVRDTEQRKLEAAEPRLADAGLRKQLGQWLVDEMGFTQNEVNGVFDSRLVRLAFRAMEGQPQKKSAGTIPTIQRPRKQTDEVSRAFSRLRRTGTVDDALAVLSARRTTSIGDT